MTSSAAQQIKELLTNNEYPDDMYLFVGVKGGGCSGLSYILDLRSAAESPPSDDDERFNSEGIDIVVDFKSFVVGNLDGTIIDYQESMMASGFVFDNPNAKTRCGCNQSFSA